MSVCLSLFRSTHITYINNTYTHNNRSADTTLRPNFRVVVGAIESLILIRDDADGTRIEENMLSDWCKTMLDDASFRIIGSFYECPELAEKLVLRMIRRGNGKRNDVTVRLTSTLLRLLRPVPHLRNDEKMLSSIERIAVLVSLVAEKIPGMTSNILEGIPRSTHHAGTHGSLDILRAWTVPNPGNKYLTSMDTNVVYILIRLILNIYDSSIDGKRILLKRKADWEYLVDWLSNMTKTKVLGGSGPPEMRRQRSKEDVVTRFKAMQADGDRRVVSSTSI